MTTTAFTSAPRAAEKQNQLPVGFDLHGIVGIRLLNADAKDAAAVNRQLGPIRGQLDRDPDITIRFVDILPTTSRLRYLGVNEAAFTDDAFLILKGKHKAYVKVQIPFDQVGGPCEILCERGAPAVPLLIPIINLTALAKGILPLHAAAFRYNETGVLVTGWSKGGKTETLLAFASRGAQYVGDEWIYITPDGKRMHGIPEPVRLWDWHLKSLPEYWPQLSTSERVRLRTLRLMLSGVDKMANAKSGAPARFMQRVQPLLKSQQHVNLPPQTLFNQMPEQLSCTLDKVLFVASHEAPDITVQPVDPQVIAQRMVFSLEEERMDFLSYYHKFRFAFPDRPNRLLEQTENIQRTLLSRMLADKEAYEVYHPYPFEIPALYDAVSAVI
ncbi:MAG: hypothetical protein H6641_09910 [Caldilineaceae bacterium]|nr:hypothetical protein [Caldilineaceae bacterium]